MNKITVITSSRNREDFLYENIKQVTKIKSLKEHLIIDFSSKKKIDQSKYDNYKTKILNIVDEDEWSITRSYNVGIYFSESEYTMKIDADILIDYAKFNKLDFQNYDILYFQDNEWDPGNFIAKTSVLKEMHGFNEFIKSRFDDNDLLHRLKKGKYTIGKAPGIIKEKIHHSDELRHSSSDNYFKKKSPEGYAYAIVKSHNNSGAYISSLNLWRKNSKLNYEKFNSGEIKITHPKYYEKLKLSSNLKLKFIYLKTFFRIYYKNKDNYFYAILKRLLPVALWMIPLKINEKIIGVKISS